MLHVRGLFVVVLVCLTPCFAGDRAARIAEFRQRAESYVRERKVALGLANASTELREVSATATTNSVIFRYQQFHDGVSVYGAELIVDLTDRSQRETNRLTPPFTLDARPKVDKIRASAIALQRAKVELTDPDEPAAELLILPVNVFGVGNPAENRLAWKVDFEGPGGGAWRAISIFVDASAGRILYVVDATPHLTDFVYVSLPCMACTCL